MSVLVSVSMVLIIYILIMTIAAVFVYKDAKKRKMNEVVWALVGFFGPFLLGVIIYLICRNPIVNLRCWKCGAEVSEKDKNCPKCGSSLLNNCPECDFPIKKGWMSCPKCGTQLPENFNQPLRIYKKENGFGIIVVIVLVLLSGIFLVGMPMCAYNNQVSESLGYGGDVGMYNITKEDLSTNKTLQSWIEKSDKSKKNVHLILSKEQGMVIVYIKDNDKLLRSEVAIDYFEDSSKINIFINKTTYEDKYGYDFYMYDIDVNDDTEVEVYIDGRAFKAEVTFTDEDISLETWREQ